MQTCTAGLILLQDFRRLTHTLFFIAVVYCASIATAFSATTYYVSPSGSDSNAGTSLSSPFRTITKAVNGATGGDTVLIRGGTYREQVDMGTGGTSGAYLNIANYGGETPVLKGSDVVTGWTQHSGAIWKKTGWTINSQQVFVDFDTRPGRPLKQIGMPSSYFTSFEYPSPVGSGLSSMTAGTFYFERGSSTLYVWLADGSSPNNHVMEASTRARILFMSRPYVSVKGLTFRHSNVVASAQQGAAVELSSNSIIRDSDIQWTDFGGLSMGYLQSNAQAINNTISNNGATGVNGAASTAFKVSGNKLNYNNYRNFNQLWHAGGFKGGARSYGIIEANEAAYNNGSGLWCDYCNSGGQIVIRNNFVHDNGPKDSGIFLEVSTNALVYNNVVVNNERRGIYVSGSSGVQVVNNTVVGTRGWASIDLNGMPRDGATLTNNTVYNNIISGGTAVYDLFIAPSNGSTIANNRSNYNNIYRNGAPLILASSQTASSLAGWRSATGFDVNSISVDPAFIGTGSATNYGVRDGSPVIDKGMSMSSLVTADYSAGARPVGAGYDIGAFEKGSTSTVTSPPPPTTTTGGTTTPPPTGTSDTPVVTLSAPSTAVVGTAVRISATASDNVGVVQMSLYVDGTKKVDVNGAQVAYTLETAALRVGTHEIRVSATDGSGNTGSATASLVIQESTSTGGTTSPTAPTPPPPTTTADSTPPVVRINTPYAGGTVSGSVSISATATDNVGVREMTLMVDGEVKARSTTGSISYTWSTWTLRSGTHSIRVAATDGAQNTGSGNISVIVQ